MIKAHPKEFVRLNLKPIVAEYGRQLGLKREKDLVNKISDEVLKLIPAIIELQLTEDQLNRWSWDVIKRNIYPENVDSVPAPAAGDEDSEEIRCGECGAVLEPYRDLCGSCGKEYWK